MFGFNESSIDVPRPFHNGTELFTTVILSSINTSLELMNDSLSLGSQQNNQQQQHLQHPHRHHDYPSGRSAHDIFQRQQLDDPTMTVDDGRSLSFNYSSILTGAGSRGSPMGSLPGLLEDEEPFDNLTAIYGPKRDPLYVVLPITIIYVLIFVTGVIGNISTCIVISKNKSMHTATNYYLFSLAISDFLLLISGVPQEIYFIWSKYPYIFGEVFCVVRGIAAETSANATVLTITAFTIERYVAICHPFLSHTMSKLSRAIRFIFAIWFVAIVSAVPQALQFGVTDQSGVDQCVVKRIIIHHSFELSTFIFFFAPMTLITVLYALIGLKLRSSTMMQRDGTLQRRNNTCPVANRQQGSTSQGTRRVLKMLVAVVVAFFICWAPFHAQRLVYIYGVDKDHQPTDPLILKLFVVTTYISGILYYLSTCINPLLYNIMSNKFRQAFKETLAHGCHVPSRKSRHGKERRPYRILPRRERRSAANKDSSEFSGNSIKDDSIYSSSTQKQSIDSVAMSRGQSMKRYSGGQQQSSSMLESTAFEPSRIMVTSAAHLNLYTEQEELCLNIFPSTGTCRSRSSENLSHISIQLNRVNIPEETTTASAAITGSQSKYRHTCGFPQQHQPIPFSTTSFDESLEKSSFVTKRRRSKRWQKKLVQSDICTTKATEGRDGCVASDSAAANLDVIYSNRQGEIKIFIKHINHHHRRSRLRFWRYFQHVLSTSASASSSNASPSEPSANVSVTSGSRTTRQRPTAVHFYSPVLCSTSYNNNNNNNSSSNGIVHNGIGGNEIGCSALGADQCLVSALVENRHHNHQQNPMDHPNLAQQATSTTSTNATMKAAGSGAGGFQASVMDPFPPNHFRPQEDDLDAYMKEIEQRANKSSSPNP
ncbi:uncharacterized protein LOC129755453 [Uranotaenia lowii]|uniref:uncharacterized protein LOC129755453 n=1 Tax=Uranotaenia lowii TaxID=190385 RepID=UPI00247B0B68|nr:uncharacterized protein LOC129755453 [Uranotaenia lowii]